MTTPGGNSIGPYINSCGRGEGRLRGGRMEEGGRHGRGDREGSREGGSENGVGDREGELAAFVSKGLAALMKGAYERATEREK